MTSGPHILIVGYYGFRNLGDEAILGSVLADMRRRVDGAVLTVVSGDPDDTRRVHGVEAIFWRDVPALVAATRSSNLVIIGGGGLFHDYWGIDPASVLAGHYYGISFLASPAAVAALEGIPLAMYGVGVGPLASDTARRLTRSVFDLAGAATVRDQASYDLLTEIGVAADRVETAADPAFRLPTPTGDEIAAAANDIGLDRTDRLRLGVVLREWSIGPPQDAWLAEVAHAVDGLVADHDAEVVLVPFQDLEGEAEDGRLAGTLCNRLRQPARAAVVAPVRGVAHARALLAGCDLVIGMRLHAVVFAASAGVPVVALSYSPKVRHLARRLGCEDLTIDIETVTADKLTDALETALSSRRERGHGLAKAAANLAKAAARNADLAVSLLDGHADGARPLTAGSRRFLAAVAEDAVLRAEAKTASAEGLVAQRDGLLGERDLLADEARDLRQERDQLTVRSEAMAAERDALVAERDALDLNRESLEQSLRDLERGHQELLAEHDNVKSTLYRITSSLSFRIASAHWRVRSRVSALSHGGARALARTLKSAGRRSADPGRGRASWYEYRFRRYRAAREAVHGRDLSAMRCPTEAGLVSVVIPVYNGEDLIAEAIDSVLAQTWERFELILVDDGSTDGTPAILDAYAQRDPRIRVIHQSNQKLPRSLSNGFRAARGELLTWSSDDNRLKPDCLARLVGCLDRHQSWDMVWANVDIIGEGGQDLEGSEWYYGYQCPPGSPHVHFPHDPSELNTWPNNYVGAAFMYRDRVAWLLGDYCPDRFTVEDYDYWMQVNEFLTLRHADFDDPIYDYRFHGKSLTSREKELRILELREQLMVFDDFRRDFALSPLIWMLGPVPETDPARALYEAIRERALALGHTVAEPDTWPTAALPRLWMPTVYVQVADGGTAAPPDRATLPPNSVTVLLTPSGDDLSADPGSWDLCAAVHPAPALHRTQRPWQGWLGFGDVPACCRALDIAVRARHIKAIETELADPAMGDVEATVVVCTYRRSDSLSAALFSLGRQSVSSARYEVVVVNNDPTEQLDDMVDALRSQSFAAHPDHVRLVLCPLKGLSHARNVGIAEARGGVVCFIDDDAVAEREWLAGILAAYQTSEGVGVVGGRILLHVPEPPPQWLDRSGWSYWSHHDPGYPEPTEVEQWWEYPWGANWSARRELLVAMGGFRYGYGRRGHDFGGGEEVVAASLARRLGARVVVTPAAVVRHHVDPARFTRRDLCHTVRAGTLVNYFTQRDLYLPMWLGPAHVLEQMGKRLMRLMLPWRLSRFERLETLCFLRAEVSLLATTLRDWRARARHKT